MLVEFSVTNYKSIAEKQTLSLVAGTSASKGKKFSFPSGNSYAPALLRGACLFGSNGSGKTTLIKAMDFFKKFVVSSAKESQAGEEIAVTPHLFDDEWANSPSEFEIIFIHQGALYQYGFAVDKNKVWKEWLFSRPNDSKARMRSLFQREYDAGIYHWDINATFVKGEKEIWKKLTRDNALFLAQAVQLNAGNDLKNVFEWVRRHFQPIGDKARFLGDLTAKKYLEKNKRDKILKLLQAVDIRIKDLDIQEREMDIDVLLNNLSNELKDNFIKRIGNNKLKGYDIQSIHQPYEGKFVALDFSEESAGTHQIFNLAGIWFESLEDGDTLIIDELDNHLHPHALEILVGLFYNHKTNPNPKTAQLIFTGHETLIMQADFMHRDHIWFLEKTKKESTEFIPLASFKPRDFENFQKAYLSGRYGGVPYVKELFDGEIETA